MLKSSQKALRAKRKELKPPNGDFIKNKFLLLECRPQDKKAVSARKVLWKMARNYIKAFLSFPYFNIPMLDCGKLKIKTHEYGLTTYRTVRIVVAVRPRTHNLEGREAQSPPPKLKKKELSPP